MPAYWIVYKIQYKGITYSAHLNSLHRYFRT